MSALSIAAVVFALSGTFGELAQEAPAGDAPPAEQRLLHWGDVDADGLDDLLAIGAAGDVTLLVNLGEGRFEDLTLASGLGVVEGATCALFADFDGDGRVDLFLGSNEKRLWRNLGNASFEPVACGIDHDWVDFAASAVDHDRDGVLDLHLHSEAGDLLYRNQGAARFERVELPETDHPAPMTPLSSTSDADGADAAALDSSATRRRLGRWLRARRAANSNASSSAAAASTLGFTATSTGPFPLAGPASMICAGTIVDLATSQCITASSTPTIGTLYPLSANFNLDSSGRVGINTTSPAHRVHVVESAGTGLLSQGGTTGVRGEANLAGAGNRYGGYFTSSGGSNNIGAYGVSTIGIYGVGLSGGYGVLGETNSSSAIGVYGKANSTGANTTGVLGQTSSATGIAVRGANLSTTGSSPAIEGVTNSNNGVGVKGTQTAAGNAIGVHGTANTTLGLGVRGDGQVGVYGGGSATGVEGAGANQGVYGHGAVGVLGAGVNIGGVFTGGGYGVRVGAPHFTFPYIDRYAGAFLAGGPADSRPTHGVVASGQEYGVFGDVPFWMNQDVSSVPSAGVVGQQALAATGHGVWGRQSTVLATSGAGVQGESMSQVSGAAAIRGKMLNSSLNDTIGVEGISEPQPYYGIGGNFKGGWIGVRGMATAVGTGGRFGGVFNASGANGTNYGVSASASGTISAGVFGTASGLGATGLYGTATGVGAIGVYGEGSGSGTYAARLWGDVTVNGTLSKGGGSFKIDHPLDPENKYLYHSFVESPDMMNVYNGNVVLDASGHAWVDLPDWFEALNRDFRYQLTPIGAPALVFVAEKVSGSRFGVGGKPGLEVSWQVTGIRKDPFAQANRIPVEADKAPEERGLFLHPDAWGQPTERRIDYAKYVAPDATKRAAFDESKALVDAELARGEQAVREHDELRRAEYEAFRSKREAERLEKRKK